MSARFRRVRTPLGSLAFQRFTAADNFEFLAFEDPKPAACEPVDLRSGTHWGWARAS